MPEQRVNFGHTTLSAGMDASQTSASVTDGNVFASSGNFRVVVDSEIMLVTARTGNTLTVQRGAESTTATTHSNGALIDARLTAGGLGRYIAEQAQDTIGVAAYRSTAQSINNATWTGILWNAEHFDTSAIHDLSSNTDRFTVPSGLGGKWTLNVCWAWNGGGGFRYHHILKNGSQYTGESDWLGPPTTGTHTTLTRSQSFELAAGDYIIFRVHQTHGSALNLTFAQADFMYHGV